MPVMNTQPKWFGIFVFFIAAALPAFPDSAVSVVSPAIRTNDNVQITDASLTLAKPLPAKHAWAARYQAALVPKSGTAH